jgi:carbon monoxide dehydrogenase subunit G
MELKGERILQAPVETVWSGLNDPETLKACIAGCESLERTGDDAFQTLVAVRVGPVSAKFKGNLKMTDVKPPNSYTINFDGQGGVAGFGKGSADVVLAPEAGATKLSYIARAQVGGKMAQVGSRLIDAAAAKITEDFFAAFEAQVAPPPAEGAVAEAAPAAGGGKRVWWIAGAVVIIAAIWWLTRK